MRNLSAKVADRSVPDVRSLPPRIVYAGLLWEAQRRGYKAGWVGINFKAIYGGWPAPTDPVVPEPPCEALVVWLNKERERWAAQRLKIAAGLPKKEHERLKARQDLLAKIGQQAFDAIPDR